MELALRVDIDVARLLKVELDVAQWLVELVKLDLETFSHVQVFDFSGLDILWLDSLFSPFSSFVVSFHWKAYGYIFHQVHYGESHIFKYISFIIIRGALEVSFAIIL